MNQSDLIDDFEALTKRMEMELERDSRFAPSLFWKDLTRKNLAMLRADGIANFKRSLSQNYFNWIVDRKSSVYRNVRSQWLRRPTLRPWRTRIEGKATIRFTNMAQPKTLTRDELNDYRLMVGYMWDVMLRLDAARLHRTLAEPEIGNPIRTVQSGKRISQDLAHSIIEANAVLEALGANTSPPRIAEIGAGSGRLAYVFAATRNAAPYCIFDIPPALCVSQWYISNVLPDRRIFQFRPFDRFEDVAEEIANADVAFFSANQITKFPPGYFDVVLSISTLPEMSRSQVDLYLNLFQSLSRRIIFLKQ